MINARNYSTARRAESKEKREMKQKISLLMTLMLLLAMVGCGGGGSGPNDNSGSTDGLGPTNDSAVPNEAQPSNDPGVGSENNIPATRSPLDNDNNANDSNLQTPTADSNANDNTNDTPTPDTNDNFNDNANDTPTPAFNDNNNDNRTQSTDPSQGESDKGEVAGVTNEMLDARGGGFEWRRVGGIAGFCDVVTVFAGTAIVASCASEPPEILAEVSLSAAQSRLMMAWLEELQTFSHEDSDGAVADGMTTSLIFEGEGDNRPTDEIIADIEELANEVLASVR